MFVDRRLDLLTADSLAATDDDTLLAVDDEQIAVLVEIDEIARTEIAIVEKGRLRRRLIVPIALEIGDRADAHLTHSALRHVAAIVIEDRKIDEWLRRRAGRQRLGEIIFVDDAARSEEHTSE